MEHGGLQSHRLQGAHAANPQHDFLADPRVDVAAIQGVGDVAILRQYVVRYVGIQQVHGDASDAELPDLNEHLAGGQFHRDLQILALGVFHRFQGQSVKVVDRIAFLLPPVGIQELAEITLLVEQAEPDQGIVLVAGRLQMVAREDPQTAGVHRQALGQAVFRGEVGDQFAIGRRGTLADSRIVHSASRTVERQVALVGGGLLQRGLGNAAQQQHRIVPAFAPLDGIEAAEHRADHGFPTPDDVVGQLSQTRQRVGQAGAD